MEVSETCGHVEATLWSLKGPDFHVRRIRRGRVNYLGFFPTDCFVALGDNDEQQAEIIKGGCFSSTLGVTKTGSYGEKLHERKAGFTFASFSGSSDLTSQNVKITCDLKICFFW